MTACVGILWWDLILQTHYNHENFIAQNYEAVLRFGISTHYCAL